MIIDQKKAKKILLEGGNVIIPTETVYGLAGSINCPNSIETIYRLKNRPKQNPLIIHFANLKQVLECVEDVPESFYRLAKFFWPGPLTMVLQGRNNLNHAITAGLKTVAVRIPAHLETLKLIEETGPLVAPSANISGRPSSTKIKHIENDFGKNFPILEGTEPICGLESTIIGWIDNKWVFLRHGVISLQEIERFLGENINHSDLQICPGTKFRHYSPEAKIFYSNEMFFKADAIVGYENRSYLSKKPFYSLGRDDDPKKIAYRLFDLFRRFDEDCLKNVWIDIKLPNEGLYITIIERILKASYTDSSNFESNVL